jgi:hypothetical protein
MPVITIMVAERFQWLVRDGHGWSLWRNRPTWNAQDSAWIGEPGDGVDLPSEMVVQVIKTEWTGPWPNELNLFQRFGSGWRHVVAELPEHYRLLNPAFYAEWRSRYPEAERATDEEIFNEFRRAFVHDCDRHG